MRGERADDALPPPASAARPRPSRRATETPSAPSRFPSSPWTSLPSLLSLSLSRDRAELVAADVHHRGHRLSLASLTGPEAPPRPPLPSTPSHATAGAPHRRHESSSPSTAAGLHRRIRRLPVVPEPAEPVVDLPVSSAAFPLCFPHLSRPLAVAFIETENHRRPSLSPASLRRPFGHPVLTNMPAASRSASLAPQLLRLHAAAPTPHMAELRPPPWSSPSLAPATIDPASTTTRCAPARALQQAQERPRPCPVARFRRPPPSRASPASSRRRV